MRWADGWSTVVTADLARGAASVWSLAVTDLEGRYPVPPVGMPADLSPDEAQAYAGNLISASHVPMPPVPPTWVVVGRTPAPWNQSVYRAQWRVTVESL